MIMVACAIGTIVIPIFYFYLEKWTDGSEVTQPVGVSVPSLAALLVGPSHQASGRTMQAPPVSDAGL